MCGIQCSDNIAEIRLSITKHRCIPYLSIKALEHFGRRCRIPAAALVPPLPEALPCLSPTLPLLDTSSRLCSLANVQFELSRQRCTARSTIPCISQGLRWNYYNSPTEDLGVVETPCHLCRHAECPRTPQPGLDQFPGSGKYPYLFDHDN